jgi:hypothetical protein
VRFVLDLEEKNPERQVAVLVPELVVQHSYQYFLHNQRAGWLKSLLLRKENQRIVVIDVPWYLSSNGRSRVLVDSTATSFKAKSARRTDPQTYGTVRMGSASYRKFAGYREQ